MKKLFLFLSAITISIVSVAQVMPMAALNSGDISSISNVKKVNIIYDYSEVGVGAFRNEEDYINKKYEEYAKKDKEKAEKFKSGWYSARKDKFEPLFETMFNKTAEKKISMTGENYSTKNDYTLLIKTTFVEPGMNIGIMKKPAYIDVECIFKDKEGKELCAFYIKNAIGQQAAGFDYDVSSRLRESYAKSAKMLVGIIKKERKKAGK